MEDDTCVSGDGDGVWAVTMLHAHEVPHVSGVMLSASWLAAPSSIPLSCLLKEVPGYFLNVGSLVSHLLFKIMDDLSLHVFQSMLDFVGGMPTIFLDFSSLSPVLSRLAIGFFGALTVKNMTFVVMKI